MLRTRKQLYPIFLSNFKSMMYKETNKSYQKQNLGAAFHPKLKHLPNHTWAGITQIRFSSSESSRGQTKLCAIVLQFFNCSSHTQKRNNLIVSSGRACNL